MCGAEGNQCKCSYRVMWRGRWEHRSSWEAHEVSSDLQWRSPWLSIIWPILILINQSAQFHSSAPGKKKKSAASVTEATGETEPLNCATLHPPVLTRGGHTRLWRPARAAQLCGAIHWSEGEGRKPGAGSESGLGVQEGKRAVRVKQQRRCAGLLIIGYTSSYIVLY